MPHPLSKVEARVEALVEGTFARWFAERLHPKDVAVQLARALEDSAAHGPAATHYAVRLHPADAEALLRHQPALPDLLAEELVTLAREAGLTLGQRPDVILLPDTTLKLRAVKVSAEVPPPDESGTQGMTPIRPGTAPLRPLNAFVILDGERTLPLTAAVLNLGRRTDNHIILDDARVSRSHAQLRLRYGRYVVYDLGSSGGTLVNGQRVQECVLRPGDVISLGGVMVIYGEEEGQDSNFKIQDSNGDTRPNEEQDSSFKIQDSRRKEQGAR